MIFPEMMAEMRRPMDFYKGMACAQILIFVVYLMYGIFCKVPATNEVFCLRLICLGFLEQGIASRVNTRSPTPSKGTSCCLCLVSLGKLIFLDR
jgi:hypothetical protein